MKLTISDRKTTEISKDLMGVFFEDINYGADGGLYAEMIENRSFEFVDCYGDKGDYYTVFDGGYGWSAYPTEDAAKLKIVSGSPVSDENPHYLRLTAAAGAGVSNKAYSGIHLIIASEYRVSFYARAVNCKGPITVQITKDERVIMSKSVPLVPEDNRHFWHKYELVFTTRENVSGGTFSIVLDEGGTVELDFISMTPVDAGGGIFRSDAMQALKALSPAFVRFPGGCIVEGNTMSNRYRFKDTLKRPEDRKSNWNRWAVHNNNEENGWHGKFSHYNQTLGLGYYEFFLMCSLIKAKPLPIMNVGMACQYQSYEYMEIGSPEFEGMVQDAIDLIEFANGSEDTKWGAVRAELGHPRPFNLEYLGIGNEQWQTDITDFFARYKIFEQRIHAVYPEIKLIGTAGPDVTSEHYKQAWSFYREELKKNPNFVYAIDEHYYMKPEWFLEHNDFYDSYPRDIKVFAGEYAAHDPDIKGCGIDKCNFGAALSEAAFLTGVERNADIVALSSYAPLFAREGYVQWSPDLIWMNERKVVKTPSYWIQKLFSEYRGDVNLDMCGQEKTLREQGIYCNVSQRDGKIVIKLANTSENDIVLEPVSENGTPLVCTQKISLKGSPKTYNDFINNDAIKPRYQTCNTESVEIGAGEFAVVLAEIAIE